MPADAWPVAGRRKPGGRFPRGPCRRPLLHRTTRSIKLSEAGERYAGLPKGAPRTRGGRPQAGRGTLGASRHVDHNLDHVTGVELLRPIVDAFMNEYPTVKARMHLLDRPVNLIDEGMDLALRIAHLADSTLVAIAWASTAGDRGGAADTWRRIRASSERPIWPSTRSSPWRISGWIRGASRRGRVRHPTVGVVHSAAGRQQGARGDRFGGGRAWRRTAVFLSRRPGDRRTRCILLGKDEHPPIPVHWCRRMGDCRCRRCAPLSTSPRRACERVSPGCRTRPPRPLSGIRPARKSVFRIAWIRRETRCGPRLSSSAPAAAAPPAAPQSSGVTHEQGTESRHHHRRIAGHRRGLVAGLPRPRLPRRRQLAVDQAVQRSRHPGRRRRHRRPGDRPSASSRRRWRVSAASTPWSTTPAFSSPSRSPSTRAEDYATVIAVNVAGFFHITQAAVGGDAEAGQRPYRQHHDQPGRPADQQGAVGAGVADQGRLNAATKSLAIEYAKRGIRVNAVSPGIIKTPMQRRDARIPGRAAPGGAHGRGQRHRRGGAVTSNRRRS